MSCELSPSASAFSTMLSAFVGSVLNGLFSGFWIAFITGWISWLSVFRIIGAGLFEFYLTAQAGTNYEKVDNTHYQSLGMSMYARAGNRTQGDGTNEPQEDEERLNQDLDAAQAYLEAHQHPAVAQRFKQQRAAGSKTLLRMFQEPERTVTVFGWLGWIWSAVYTPVSQSIWLAVHVSSDDGAVQLVRALAIGVSALGLTFDIKQRYGAVLGRKLGSWAFVAFNVYHATVCLILGIEAAVLLILGALHIDSMPIPLFVIYPIFALIWAAASWKLIPPIDGGRPGKNIFLDVLMGAFAGIFVAAPAFGLWQSRKFDADTGFGGYHETGLNLGDYLNCESASVLDKFAAIMP